MTSSYLLYQTSSHPIKQDPPAMVTATNLNMPAFAQKPYDQFAQNDTTSQAAFQPPPPTRRPPPVPVPVPIQQPGMAMSTFPHRPLEIPPTANMETSVNSQSSSRNNSEPVLQGRNSSVAQTNAGTSGSNEPGPRSPGIFAALLGRAPRMTKSRPSSIPIHLDAMGA